MANDTIFDRCKAKINKNEFIHFVISPCIWNAKLDYPSSDSNDLEFGDCEIDETNARGLLNVSPLAEIIVKI